MVGDMARGLPIYGDEFEKLRKEMLLSQGELAQKLEMSTSGVQRIERSYVAYVVPKTLRKIALLNGATVDGVLSRLQVPEDIAKKIAAEAGEKESLSPAAEYQSPGQKTFRQIPIWDMDIAAGAWVAVPVGGELDCDDPVQRAVIEQGLFRVRINGDSMERVWHDDEIVEFQIVRADRDDLRAGDDYMIIRSDSTGTFKRLETWDDGHLVLRAVNRKKYREPIRIALQEVVRIARANGVFIPRGR